MRMKAILLTSLLSVAVTGSAYAADAAKGEEMFKKKCATCHHANADKKVGPGMAGVTTRRTEAWLDTWLSDTKEIIKAGKDPVVVELMKDNKVKMPTVKEMTDPAHRADMIAYLKKNDGK